MNFDINFFISLMGVAFVLLGIYIRMGNLKKIYWKSPRSASGYIPLGLVFVVAGFYDRFSRQPTPIFYAYIAVFALLIGLTLLAGARTPAFLKPEWTAWVEKHPKSIQKAMAAAAEEQADWEKNVASEAAVDAWARQLARKQPKAK